jgi:hypothetical protein
MATTGVRNIDSPDETRPFHGHGHADVVTLDDFTIGRGVFEAGWKWANDINPLAGTESCQVHHTGICVSGQMTIRMNDGTEFTLKSGDVFNLQPGHDAWVDGPEACVLYDTGMVPYAVKRS